MANYDNPNGFEVLTPCCGGNRYTLGGTVAKGDLVKLGAAGTVTAYDIAADLAALGVALSAGTSGDEIEVADHPYIEIVGQCSGTFAATNIGDRVDVEGTTGIMEVNENASVVGVLTIVRHYATAGSMDIGANSRVVCSIARHQKAAEQTSGAGAFDSLTATTSVTAATGVFGGGFGATGLSIASTGNLDTNGAVGIDGAVRVGTAGASNFTASAAGAITAASTATITGAAFANGGLDRSAAAALSIGVTNATSIELAKTMVTTTVNGPLVVDEGTTLTGDVAIGANKFNVTASNGNTQIDGTCSVDGAFDVDGAVRVGTGGASNATISAAGALVAVTSLARPARATKVEHYEEFLQAAGATLPLPYGKAETSAAGTMTIDFVDSVAGGVYTLTHDATDELQTGTLHWADKVMIDPAKGPIMEFRAKLNNGNPFSADQRCVMGLASALNADLDNVTSCAWFRVEGASMNIVVEGDDGTTNSDDVATGITIVDNAWTVFRIDMTSLAAIAFTVDGVACSTTVSAPLLSASTLLQPYFCIQKDGGTETDSLQIDYVQIWQTR